VYFHQASAGRRNLARVYGMLVVVAEIAASLLPIADAGFASPGQALAPYVVAVAILLLFCAFNCLAAYRTGTLPGLKSFGVKAVLVEDGGPAEWAAVKKYAVEGFVGLFTLVGGLLLILKYTTDELGRTWFDRLTGIIYVDAHRPIEEESEEWDDEDDLEEAVVARDGIHPLPHVVANRRWQLSLPPRTSQLGQRLQRLRQRAEGRTYNVLKDAIRKDYDHYVSDYEDLYALDDELFSMAFVPEGVPGASIPVVDVIAFECGHSVLDVPYTEVVGQLPHLVKPHPGTHPPRVIVAHPSEEDYARLGSLTL